MLCSGTDVDLRHASKNTCSSSPQCSLTIARETLAPFLPVRRGETVPVCPLFCSTVKLTCFAMRNAAPTAAPSQSPSDDIHPRALQASVCLARTKAIPNLHRLQTQAVSILMMATLIINRCTVDRAKSCVQSWRIRSTSHNASRGRHLRIPEEGLEIRLKRWCAKTWVHALQARWRFASAAPHVFKRGQSLLKGVAATAFTRSGHALARETGSRVITSSWRTAGLLCCTLLITRHHNRKSSVACASSNTFG